MGGRGPSDNEWDITSVKIKREKLIEWRQTDQNQNQLSPVCFGSAIKGLQLTILLLVRPLFITSSQVLYFEDDYLEVELAIHIYVDKWPMTLAPTIEVSGYTDLRSINEDKERRLRIDLIEKLMIILPAIFYVCDLYPPQAVQRSLFNIEPLCPQT